LETDTINRFGLNRYTFKADLDLNELFKHYELQEDIYDLFFDIKFIHVDQVRRIRIGKPRFKARFNTKSSSAMINGTVFSVSPYYTFRLANLSFQVDTFNTDTYRYLRKMMRWSFITHLYYKRKDIWLIGERINKAQDTGYHLFKYIREYYPERNVYYVIDKNSPEAENVEQLGNVIYYKSKEHIKATI